MHTHKSHFLSILIAGLLLTIIFSPLLINVARADENPPLPVEEPPNKVYLPTISTDGVPPQKNRVLALVSMEHDIPIDDLEIINTTLADYPLQGLQTSDYKIINNMTGEIFILSLDERLEKRDPEVLNATEQTLYLNLYGKLEPELAQKLSAGTLDPNTELIMWLKEPPFEGLPKLERDGDENMPAKELTEADYDAVMLERKKARMLRQAERMAAVEKVTTPIVQRLNELGYEVSADPLAPMLITHLPASTIETVRNWEEVDEIFLARKFDEALEVARGAVRANTVNNRTSNGYRLNGRGVRVAVIEGNGRMATGNPYLSFTNNATNTCPSASVHATAIAGVIRSTASPARGIATGTELWVGGACHGEGTFLMNASAWAINWGAKIMNLSWGFNTNRVLSSADRYYDSLIVNYYTTVVVSAGNESCSSGCTNEVSSPALSYNTIAVGNFDDHNTTGWAGDSMYYQSSYNDPVSNHNDREKPEVSAPGTNINTTRVSSPWIGNAGSGTSLSAPVVAGVAALMMQRNNILEDWPEAVKAILMTTAVNNIEGSERLSDKDGAGGISADKADDITADISGSWGGRAYTCGTGSPLALKSMYLLQGVRTRVTIAWNNNPSYSDYKNRPGADLDLRILNSSGTVVAQSTSWDNNFEIVDFTPSASGFYRISVVKARCSYSPKYLGWAWRRGN